MFYNVIEKFLSIDGEGPSSGELATFIRFLGCDLRCAWCDTKYSWDGSVKPDKMTEHEIYNYIKDCGATNVTLTGGEPLIQKNIDLLIKRLLEDETLTIRIETHGGVNISPFKDLFSSFGNRLQFILDFKLPTSKMMSRMCLENFDEVEKKDVYKFVIASANDLDVAVEIIKKHNLSEKTQVYLSPVVDLIAPKLLVERMIDEKLNGVRLQLQLHKYIWPKDMRGV